MTIGITGSEGFVGYHLRQHLIYLGGAAPLTYDVPDFADAEALDAFVAQCTAVVHLAAVNRDDDEQRLHDTNVRLVERLVAALERTGATPTVIFSSSTHITRDTLYARSKRRGMELLEAWSARSGARVANLVIPNVFGPFAQPKYNSVVATFCHKLAHGETPEVHQDSPLELIYVNELCADVVAVIEGDAAGEVALAPRHRIGVAELAQRLTSMAEAFAENGQLPDLADATDRALYNTLYCYWYANHDARAFVRHADERGSFIEVARVSGRGQFSYSTTVPGVTRGNHFHTRKAERFAVIMGKARIGIRRVGTDETRTFDLDGDSPGWIDMPIWHAHNITNTGDDELVCLFWISEPYNPEDADTYYENV